MKLDKHETHTFEVVQRISVTGEDVDDIMSSALDDIGYWAEYARVDGEYLGEYASEQISRGGSLWILEQDEKKPVELTLQKLINGIKIWKEQGYDRYLAVQPNGTLDCSMIDGEMADIIVQCALFGDIMYG